MADFTASTAMRTLPSVPFLKPTGQERPEASSRWIWLSVVRAPIAAQATRSAMYCGVVMSRNSQPAGRPRLLIVEQHVAREPQAVVDVEAAVEIGIVDQALPADRGARLLEIDAHDDLEAVGQLFAQAPRGARRSRPRRRGRGWSRGRRRPARRSSVPCRMSWMALRAAITTRVAVKVRGISRITSCGVLSSFSSQIRRSSVVLNMAVAPVVENLPAKKKPPGLAAVRTSCFNSSD